MRKMKGSGVPWIGEIPEDWDVCQIGRMIRFTSGQALPSEKIGSESGEYEVYGGNGLRGYTDSCFLHGEYVLIGRQGAQCGNVHVVSGDFWATEHALIAYEDLPLNRHWLFYILSSMDLNQYSTSAAQPGLAAEQIRKKYFCIPPIHEQNYIASYLDTQCSRIDATIANIRTLIEKLKEYKQSVITQAVTKGLDPDAPMKDSGVPWIGEIPEEWELCRIKYLIQIENGSNPKTEGDIPVYGSGETNFKTCGEFKIGPTVLLGRKGATLHIPHYIEGKYWNIDTAFDTKCINDNIFLRYFYYLSICFDYNLYISQTTLPGMTQTNYENMIIPVPNIKEQLSIVAYIDTKCAKIDSQIAEQETLLTKLEAYKKSLIYECVTGKREIPASFADAS